jgi:hypothetical protein
MRTFDDGRKFWSEGSSGRWASEQLIAAMNRGEELTAEVLRSNATLRRDEWIEFDEALIEEGLQRLQGVADLISAGLTRPIANSLGTTVLEWENVGEMTPASVSMTGLVRTENDALEFAPGTLPLPIIHKDFAIDIRKLSASRKRGEGLDTTMGRGAGRVCAEESERMLFQGGKTFGGMPIYGYLTHPNRNTISFGAGGSWALTTKTGDEMLADLLAIAAVLEADNVYGPFWMYVSGAIDLNLQKDYKAAVGGSIKQRLLQYERLQRITVVDFLPANTVLVVVPRRENVVMALGETLQTIQWDFSGGFGVNFKAFMIQVPLIRATQSGKSGIVHMS